MHWQFTPYVFPVVVSGVVSAALGLSAWRRRPTLGATTFSLLMLAVAEWSLGYALELASADLASKLFWTDLEYLGIVSAPVLWLVFALQYTGRAGWLTHRTLVLLTIEPLIILVLVWTNARHGLIYSAIRLDTSGSFSAMIVTHSVAFWVHVAYSYLLLLLGTLLIGLLVHTFMRSAPPYRGQASALLLAVLAPWVSNALTIFGWSPWPQLDLTPFAFMVSGLALAGSLFRFQLLDLVPVAREAVIESMRDAVVVLDAHTRIVDLNLAAQHLLGGTASQAVGQPVTQVFSAWPQLVERCQEATEVHEEIVLGEGKAERCFDLRISPLAQRNAHLTVTGRLIVLHDITERKQAEASFRASEERFRHVFEEAPIGMALMDMDGRLLQVNTVFCELLGYREHELLGSRLAALTHPDDVDKDALLAVQAVKGTLTSYRVEKRYRNKNGEMLWAQLTATMLRDHDGQPSYRLVMLENIIERKRAKLLEEEQRHIAYELQEGLAQVAVSVHQHLQAFAGRYRPRSPQARQQLERALELAQRSVREAQRVIAGLRPTALDDFGLTAALHLLVEALRAEGLEITHNETLGPERLPPAIEIALFGVAQEALTNVRKHAGTTPVRLALERHGSLIRLQVQDWGYGFEPHAVLGEPNFGEYVGLHEMQERVELVGGHLRVSSRPGMGTLILAEVPLLTPDERSASHEQ